MQNILHASYMLLLYYKLGWQYCPKIGVFLNNIYSTSLLLNSDRLLIFCFYDIYKPENSVRHFMAASPRSAKFYYTRNSTATDPLNVETTKRNEWHPILKQTTA